jgi:hypothetical protein
MATTTGGVRTKRSSSQARSKARGQSNSGSSSKQSRQSASRRQGHRSGGSHAPSEGKTAAAMREGVQHAAKETGETLSQAAKEAGEVLSKTAKDSGKTLGSAAKKAKSYGKTPLLVGGTALAGAAGGLALGARRNRPLKVLGAEIPHNGIHLKSRNVARTARQMGRLTETAGHIAAELRRADESNGKTRLSPIEVVLRGLTARR